MASGRMVEEADHLSRRRPAGAWMRRLFLLTTVAAASGCWGGTELVDRPESRYVLSRLSRPDGELLVVATYSGGAAGDTIHRLLACPAAADECEVLAAVDTNDNQAPGLTLNAGRIILSVNWDDTIGQFRNYSRTLNSVPAGTLYLSYRPRPFSSEGRLPAATP